MTVYRRLRVRLLHSPALLCVLLLSPVLRCVRCLSCSRQRSPSLRSSPAHLHSPALLLCAALLLSAALLCSPALSRCSRLLPQGSGASRFWSPVSNVSKSSIVSKSILLQEIIMLHDIRMLHEILHVARNSHVAQFFFLPTSNKSWAGLRGRKFGGAEGPSESPLKSCPTRLSEKRQ